VPENSAPVSSFSSVRRDRQASLLTLGQLFVALSVSEDSFLLREFYEEFSFPLFSPWRHLSSIQNIFSSRVTRVVPRGVSRKLRFQQLLGQFFLPESLFQLQNFSLPFFLTFLEVALSFFL